MMRHWKAAARRWCTLAATVISVLGPCTGAVAQTLTIGVSHGPVSLPVYVAQANGYFEREGLGVSVRDCSSGRDCYKLMAEGNVQVATAAELVATLNSFTRPDLAFIASISNSSYQIKIVARRSAGITTPASMAGKRVGTVAGSSAQYFLDSWLLFHNLGASSEVVVPIPPEQIAGALQRRDIDAAAIWEPVATSAFTALGADGLMLPSPRVYTQNFGLITTRATIEAHEADLLKLLRALLQAEHFIAEQPLKAQQLLVARLGIDRAFAAAQMREHDFRIRLDQSLSSTMDSQARWAVRGGHVQTKTRSEDVVNAAEPALLRKVAPGAVTLVR